MKNSLNVSIKTIASVIVVSGIAALVGYNYLGTSNKSSEKVEDSQIKIQGQTDFLESQDILTRNRVTQKNVNEHFTSKLLLRTLDVSTGISVIPERIELKQRKERDIVYTYEGNQVVDNGVIVMSLKNGTYDIVVTAKGYQQMTSHFTFNNDSLNVNFNMERLIPQKELMASFIDKLRRKDALVILGFITDEQSGKPVEGVAVFSEDKIAQSISQKNGFFQLVLPLIENYSQKGKRGKVLFTKTGYKTEMRSNFDIIPNGDMILQIRLQQGVGLNSEAILKKRSASYVTIREAMQTE